MKLIEVPVGEAADGVLAHSRRLPSGRVLKKGLRLTATDVELLQEAQLNTITIARLDDGDVPENEAALQAAEMVVGRNIRVDRPFTGRCNLFSERHGLLQIDPHALTTLNRIDPGITLATLSPFARVRPRDMVATLKIIPFAVSQRALDAWYQTTTNNAPLVSVAPFVPRSAGLVLTILPGTRGEQLARVEETMRQRLHLLGSRLTQIEHVPHTVDAVADALNRAVPKCDVVLAMGASAVIDENDVVPAAMRRAGGSLTYLGMPVDPGNLLALGEVRGRPVMGVPGCARSLKVTGFDWVLERLLAGVPTGPLDISAMGSGGLLTDVAQRPLPRGPESVQPQVAAVVLAAGESQRMGDVNKLGLKIGGEPMVARVIRAVEQCGVRPIVVVVGHQADKVRGWLAGADAVFIHASDYRQGMSASLNAGLKALAAGVDGALICLGDMPWIHAGHIEAVLRAFNPTEGRAICIPTYQGRRGHPLLLGSQFFEEVASLEGDVGAKSVVERHAGKVCEVPVEDSGILQDVDNADALPDEELATLRP